MNRTVSGVAALRVAPFAATAAAATRIASTGCCPHCK